MQKTLPVLLLAALILGCAHSQIVILDNYKPDLNNLFDVVNLTPGLSVFNMLAQSCGVVDDLVAKGPYTLMVPNDQAFGKLPDGSIQFLLQNPKTCKRLLQYHLLQGNYRIEGIEIAVKKSGTLSNVNTLARNERGEYMTMGFGMRGAGKFYCYDQTRVQANMMPPQLLATNGVVHIIDTVLNQNDAWPDRKFGLGGPRPDDDRDDDDRSKDMNLLEVARTVPELEKFVLTVEAAGLRRMMEDTYTPTRGKNFTVLAFTDAAMGRYMSDDDFVTMLWTKEGHAKAERLLRYHISQPVSLLDLDRIRDMCSTKGAAEMVTQLKTGQGKQTTVRITMDQEGQLTVTGANNDAEISLTEFRASNGVILLLDTVLDPPGGRLRVGLGGDDKKSETIAEAVSRRPEFSTFRHLLSRQSAVWHVLAYGTGHGITLFVPTDKAFAKMDQEKLAEILKDDRKCAQLIRFMIVPPRKGDESMPILTEELRREPLLNLSTMIQGRKLQMWRDGGKVYINGNDQKAKLVQPFDYLTSNGALHAIDTVLLPPFSPLATGNFLSVGVSGPGGSDKKDIAHTIFDRPDLSILAGLIMKAGLAEALSDAEGGPYTVFAPNDAAFKKLGPALSVLDLLPKKALATVLKYHVAQGSVKTSDLPQTKQRTITVFKTLLEGAGIYIDRRVNNPDTDQEEVCIRINNAGVIADAVDIEASNGVVHVIDSVLIPQPAELGSLHTFDTLTVEPPVTDHVVASSGPDGTNEKSIAEMINDREDLTILARLLKKAGLDEALCVQEGGPYTIFAPNNEAFKRLGPLAFALDLLPKRVLANVLKYHVAKGSVKTGDLPQNKERTITSFKTLLSGTSIDIERRVDNPDTDAERVRIKINMFAGLVGDAFDIEASNGVIHVIDSVLIPKPSEPRMLNI
eukprot:GDKI01042515.1.p1 GENE.GDKI01042515.1~~GDKI01042515.1.p1  ORF type:complete len:910 (-),score=293.64 GDKI01042515.1:379-3108(-)